MTKEKEDKIVNTIVIVSVGLIPVVVIIVVNCRADHQTVGVCQMIRKCSKCGNTLSVSCFCR